MTMFSPVADIRCFMMLSQHIYIIVCIYILLVQQSDSAQFDQVAFNTTDRKYHKLCEFDRCVIN